MHFSISSSLTSTFWEAPSTTRETEDVSKTGALSLRKETSEKDPSSLVEGTMAAKTTSGMHENDILQFDNFRVQQSEAGEKVS